jgi:hypothetical protein
VPKAGGGTAVAGSAKLREITRDAVA